MRAARRPVLIFLAFCAAGVLSVFLYARFAAHPTRENAAAEPNVRYETIASIPPAPFVIFRNASAGQYFGRIAIARLPVSGDARLIAPLSCDRVHYAAGYGICMASDETRLPQRYFAEIFDRDFNRLHTVALTGPPVRTRVSPDGRRAALTVFERGHSYAEEGFSTRTIVVATATGRNLGDLEQFAVEKDGRPFKSVDFNFWGVTFAQNGDRFYATLKTHGHRYLVEGSVDSRHMTVLRDDVECPSLSPDERLLVFKKPLEGEVGWRLHVLELATGQERPLRQAGRSVDDQVDWFDDTHVVYHDSAPEGTGVWVVGTDGVTAPLLLLANGYSPAVERAGRR